MRTEDSLFLILAGIIGLPLALWLYQDAIFGFLQVVDLFLLKGFSMIPLIGGYFERYATAYDALAPEQLRFQHVWIASNVAWRPIVLLLITPMCLRWAWGAYKKRRAQSFNNMTKGFLDKHLKSPQTVPGSSRQQWTVRRWFHFYGLNGMKWGGAKWHRRLLKAFEQQIGVTVSDPKGQEMVKEFATFMYEEAKRQFGQGSADILPAEHLYQEAIKQHAYISTAMVRILAASRDQFGVLSPNGFRNRLFQDGATVPIWFALNGFGRQTTHIESLAILSHFYEEITKGEPIQKIQVDNAIEGLEQYRDHHVDRRKLSDLDETEKLEAEAKRKERAQQQHVKAPAAEERYDKRKQLLT